MRIRNYGRFNSLFAVMAAVALVLASIGILNVSSTPYSGYQATADFKAFRVDPNGPAAKAGIRDGDRIAAIGGVATDQLHQLSRLERASIGEELTVTVLRDRQRLDLRLAQTDLPAMELFLKWGGNVMALAMLALGLGVYWRRPSKASSLFFLANLSFALAFTAPPYFRLYVLRTLVSVNSILFLTLGLAFLLHLSVVYPKPKVLIKETGIIEYLIYLPAPVMALSFLGMRLFMPKADLLVNLVLHGIFASLVLLCAGIALAALVHSFVVADSQQRAQGMTVMIIGALLGVVLPSVKFAVETFFPETNLPGQPFYSLAAILVSLGVGWSLWKGIASREQPPKIEPILFKRAAGM